MTDEEDRSPAHAEQGAGLLYDYLKHVASLSLITLGGILTISQMDATDDISAVNLITAIVLVGIGGGLSFACTTELANARYTGKPTSRAFEYARKISPASFLLGIGYALAMFVDVMF